MADLLINSKDALTTYGVRMGEEFIDSLLQPSNFKSSVSNRSRLEDGVRYTIVERKVDEREVTLAFVLVASTKSEAQKKLSAFLSVLSAKEVTIEVPAIDTGLIHLIATECASFHRNLSGTLYSIKAKFTEPNPNNRT